MLEDFYAQRGDNSLACDRALTRKSAGFERARRSARVDTARASKIALIELRCQAVLGP